MWYYESLANQWPAPPWATDSQRFVGMAKPSRTVKSKFGTESYQSTGSRVIMVQCRNCTIIKYKRRTAANQWRQLATIFCRDPLCFSLNFEKRNGARSTPRTFIRNPNQRRRQIYASNASTKTKKNDGRPRAGERGSTKHSCDGGTGCSPFPEISTCTWHRLKHQVAQRQPRRPQA